MFKVKKNLFLALPNIAHILPFISVVVYPFIGIYSYFFLNAAVFFAFISQIYLTLIEKRFVFPKIAVYLLIFFFTYIFSYIFSPVRDIISAENVNFFMGLLLFLTVLNSKGYSPNGYLPWMYASVVVFLMEEIGVFPHRGNINLMAFVFIIFSGILLEDKRYYHALVFFAAILLTKSISAIFGVLAASVVYLYDNREWIEWKKNAFAFGIIFILFISLFYFIDVSSMSDRLEWWLASLRMFIERPFSGWGYASFTYILSSFLPSSFKTLYPHNHFLSVLCEGGIIAFVFWIFFVVKTFSYISGVSRYVFISVLIHSFFDIGPDTSAGWWLFMYYFARILKMRASLFIASVEYKKTAYALIGISLILFFKFLNFSYYLWNVEKVLNKIYSSSDFHLSLELSENALKKYPTSIDLAMARAYLYYKLALLNKSFVADYIKAVEYILILNPYRNDIYTTLLNYYSNADKDIYREVLLRRNKYIKVR